MLILEMTKAVPGFEMEETTFHAFLEDYKKLEKERTIKSLISLILLLFGCIFNFGASICGLILTQMDFNHAPAMIQKTLLSMPATSLIPAAPDVPKAHGVPEVSDVLDA